VRVLHLVLFADILDAAHDLADHVVHVEAEVEAVLDGQSAADVQRVQVGQSFFRSQYTFTHLLSSFQ
jgi:hypothetical protein